MYNVQYLKHYQLLWLFVHPNMHILVPLSMFPAAVEKLRITEHPRSQEVPLESPATLSCRASGPGYLSYLWYLNGLSLPEDNTPDYHIESATEDDEGLYSCEVFCQASSLMSNMARLSLKK